MQKRMNPYVVLGIGVEADARAANLAFIQRVAKFKSLENPPYATAELEWALKEIEAANAAGQLIDTFDVPAVPEAYDVPALQSPGLPVVRLERKTPAGDAVKRFQEALLAEARRTLKDAIAELPEFFTGSNTELADAEDLADLPPFGTWANEQRRRAERKAATSTTNGSAVRKPSKGSASEQVEKPKPSRKSIFSWRQRP